MCHYYTLRMLKPQGTDFGKEMLAKIGPAGPIMAKGDQFWQQNQSGRTSFGNFFAKFSPAGPSLGGINFGVTELMKEAIYRGRGQSKYPSNNIRHTKSSKQIYQSTCKIELLLSFFPPTSIRLWNSLPCDLYLITDLNNFTSKLDSIRYFRCTLYAHTLNLRLVHN